MISSADSPVIVDLVRLVHGDLNPAGPGPKSELVDILPQRIPGAVQYAYPGSCMVASRVVSPETSHLEVRLLVWPSRPNAGRTQGLVGFEHDEASPLAVVLGSSGRPEVRLNERTTVCPLPRPLHPQRWYRLTATFCSHGSSLEAVPMEPIPGDEAPMRATDATPVDVSAAATVVLGATVAPRRGRGRRPRNVFDGKLERPVLLTDGGIAAEWRFELDLHSSSAVDTSGHGRHGELINMPTRAVRGHCWTGDVLDHRLDPTQYGAIHFHEDDLSDAAWDVSATLRLPEDLRSGVYAVRLQAGAVTDHVPFIVRPRSDQRRAAVALLMPSFTYTAYGNQVPRARHGRSDFHPLDKLLDERQDLGKSLYDVHSDASGVIYATLSRPVVQLRPDFRHLLTQAPRHLGADLYLVDWLEQQAIEYDVICDHDLHREGEEVLAPYAVLLTGSHPEYCSVEMMDAFNSFVSTGGRLMYLGGNGFYWVTTADLDDPQAIEVRRHMGTRTWEGNPGERHHSMTGESGGLWRSRGRSPHALTGVGMTAQGWSGAEGYRRTTESYELQFEWIFEGIESNVIGDYGLVMGGASGDELDRTEPRWGTPPQTVVLATSLPHTDGYHAVVEEALSITGDLSARSSPNVRSDITIVESVGGGAVFSVGSIAFTGSLSWNNYENDVSKMTRNVLVGFLAREGRIS